MLHGMRHRDHIPSRQCEGGKPGRDSFLISPVPPSNTRHSAATAVSGASWDEPAVGLDLGAIRKLATLGQNFWEDIHAPGKVSPLDMLKIRPTPVMK